MAQLLGGKDNVRFANEIDVSKIKYSEMKAFGDHAKIMYLLNEDNHPIYIQTPKMRCPYGLGRFDDGERTKYTLDLSFGTKNTKHINQLKELLENIDNKILDDSVSNSQAWFKKKKQSKDVSQALFSHSVKVATEDGEPTDKYPPTFKLKISKNKDESFRVGCYDSEPPHSKLESDLPYLLQKGKMVQAIVKLSGVWFAGGKFGVIWELFQICVSPNTQISEYSFKDESDDEPETSESNPGEDPNEFVPDSEDDL